MAMAPYPLVGTAAPEVRDPRVRGGYQTTLRFGSRREPAVAERGSAVHTTSAPPSTTLHPHPLPHFPWCVDCSSLFSRQHLHFLRTVHDPPATRPASFLVPLPAAHAASRPTTTTGCTRDSSTAALPAPVPGFGPRPASLRHCQSAGSARGQKHVAGSLVTFERPYRLTSRLLRSYKQHDAVSGSLTPVRPSNGHHKIVKRRSSRL